MSGSRTAPTYFRDSLIGARELADKVIQKNVLLTGPPGCGKSTIIEKIVQRISLPCTGFFTREIREKGRRVGFSIATLDGRRGVMAHIDIRSRYRVGKYGVDVQSIDTIAVPSMVAENENVVVVVDEIGKMECFSALFRHTLLRVLDSPNTVVGSIALKGGAFINPLKKRPDTLLIPVFEKNRKVLAEEVLSRIELTPEDTRAVVSFVQEALGCGCPDEVLQDIQIEAHPYSFAGQPIDYLVRIGGRLLLAISMSSRWAEVAGKLRRLLETGKNLRDRNGFSRFRLVVSSDEPENPTAALQEQFIGLAGMDDKVHLHVIRPSALPRCLR